MPTGSAATGRRCGPGFPRRCKGRSSISGTSNWSSRCCWPRSSSVSGAPAAWLHAAVPARGGGARQPLSRPQRHRHRQRALVPQGPSYHAPVCLVGVGAREPALNAGRSDEEPRGERLLVFPLAGPGPERLRAQHGQRAAGARPGRRQPQGAAGPHPQYAQIDDCRRR